MRRVQGCALAGCLGMALSSLTPTVGCCIESTCPESVVIVEAEGLDDVDLDVVVELGESIVVEVSCPANEGCSPPIEQGVLVSRRADSGGSGLLVTMRQVDPDEAPVMNLTISGGGEVFYGTTELSWRQGLDPCSDTVCAQANTQTISLEQ